MTTILMAVGYPPRRLRHGPAATRARDGEAWLFEAAWWGLLAGSALVLGALVGYLARVPRGVVAAVMGFGSGVLMSAVSFELIAEAHEQGGLAATAAGAGLGALVYTAANVAMARRGARHRKRSGGLQPSEAEHSGSGTAIAVGALLDGIPESVVIGTSLVAGGGVSAVTVAAVFISNVPEGLSSAAGMRRAGRSPRYVFGLWTGIALVSGLASMVGHGLLADAPPVWTAGITAFAGGAILSMVADTMIPEAFDDAHLLVGLVTVAGFLTAFALSHA
ncbi:ZIP family metal transporter [Saccharothrix hoggarensis]|uniref:ZIP family metal transporter n=1 Tax=Saccharothrix hoggarensis TaxID=913853 RepID=A0ABW3QSF1_9PSEU